MKHVEDFFIDKKKINSGIYALGWIWPNPVKNKIYSDSIAIYQKNKNENQSEKSKNRKRGF